MSMMGLLDAHLEQMSLCSASIAELPFPPPKIFTNALLHPHDITALIRDTEAHERALFSVPLPPPLPKAHDPSASSNRRNTTFNANGNSNIISGGGANAVRAPRRNTAVAAVLGGDLVERIRRGGGGGAGSGLGYRSIDGRDKGDIDVEILLVGAEKLCGVYPIPGAAQKIASLRQRHRQLVTSIAHYEARVADQATQLNRLNRPRDEFGSDDEGDEEQVDEVHVPAMQDMLMTEEELRKEEEEIQELEQKKQGLENRVSALGKNITGAFR